MKKLLRRLDLTKPLRGLDGDDRLLVGGALLALSSAWMLGRIAFFVATLIGGLVLIMVSIWGGQE